MTPRTRRYITRNKYSHWWATRPIIGYDSVIKQATKEVNGETYHYLHVSLYPNLYINPTDNNGFRVTNLSGYFVGVNKPKSILVTAPSFKLAIPQKNKLA